MKIKLLSILLFTYFMVTSCKTRVDNSATYFSGQIINPKSNKVDFYFGDSIIRTTKLNDSNQFSVTLNNLNDGLYTFKHGDEFQYLYLSKGDSIIMRLNTWDFDESLVFSGHGAKKNNYLIKLFLENENDEKSIINDYKLTENEFIKIKKEQLSAKINRFNNFKSKNKLTTKFIDLVDVAIKFPIYSTFENYLVNHNNYTKNTTSHLSDSFYNFRKEISLNKVVFTNYYAFNNYVGNFILNQAKSVVKNDSSKVLSSEILKQINTKITNQKFKNSLLHNAFVNCLLDNKCYDKDKNEVKQIFYKNCTDKKRIKNVNAIVNSLNYFKKGSEIPNLALNNSDNNKTTLKQIIRNKKTVIYFWPKEQERIFHMSKRVHFLIKKHVDYQFIGIDNQLENNRWNAFINTYKMEEYNQFQLNDKSQNKWFSNEIPRAVIVNKKGIVQNEFTYLSHFNFEKLLK